MFDEIASSLPKCSQLKHTQTPIIYWTLPETLSSLLEQTLKVEEGKNRCPLVSVSPHNIREIQENSSKRCNLQYIFYQIFGILFVGMLRTVHIFDEGSLPLCKDNYFLSPI